jgi:hypothetical protein
LNNCTSDNVLLPITSAAALQDTLAAFPNVVRVEVAEVACPAAANTTTAAASGDGGGGDARSESGSGSDSGDESDDDVCFSIRFLQLDRDSADARRCVLGALPAKVGDEYAAAAAWLQARGEHDQVVLLAARFVGKKKHAC